MVIELDLKDRKILLELELNARASASQIGKQTGLSQEVVNYRIKRLEERGVIKNYMPIIDFFKIGFQAFKMFVQFQHISEEKHKEIVDFLLSKNTNWVVDCNGWCDLIFAVVTDNISEFEQIKNEFLEKYSDFVATKTTSIMTETRTSSRVYLTGKKHKDGSPMAQKSTSKRVEFSKENFVLLRALTKNARASVLEISKLTNLSPRMVNYMMRKLSKEKVILGYRVSLDLEKIGYKYFKSCLYLGNASEKRRQALLGYCDSHPNMIHSVVALADWDIEAEFEVGSNEEFYKIVDDIRDKFSDIVKTIETVMIVKEYRFNYI